MKKNNQPQNQLSIYHWKQAMIMNASFNKKIVEAILRNERPNLCSITFERMCVGKCLHCIYKPCKTSSARDVDTKKVTASVLNITKQLSDNKKSLRQIPPALVHAGREFRKEDIPTLLKAKKLSQNNLLLWLLNGGDFMKYEREIAKAGLLFDGIDISIDGPSKIHNLQRDSKESFQRAILAIKRARKIITPKGTVNAAVTITKLNYAHVFKTVAILLNNNLVDNINIALISPGRKKIASLEISDAEFVIFWKQLKKVFKKYNASKQKVFFQIFREQDLAKIVATVGPNIFWQAFQQYTLNKTTNGIIGMYVGKIKMCLEGVCFSYYPMSLSITEGILMDADGSYRVALAQPYSIAQLKNNPKLKRFTIAKLNSKTNLEKIYFKAIQQWFGVNNKLEITNASSFGQSYFRKELELFKKIRETK